MKRIFLIGSLFAILVGCSSNTRTKYQPLNYYGGFSNANLSNKFKVARFSGNAYTVSRDARNFSLFRAVETCLEEGLPIAKILDIIDLTSEDVVYRASHYSMPVIGGSRQTTSQLWSQRLRFPSYDTIYFCSEKAYSLRIEAENLNMDKTKHLSKDFLGGVLVKEVAANSINHNILIPGDLVVKFNSQRIETFNQLIYLIHTRDIAKKVVLDIYRDGKAKQVKVDVEDVTDETNAINIRLIKDLCRIDEVKSRPICKYPEGAELNFNKTT